MPENTELKDVVSLATKILRYLPNSNTLQMLEKVSAVLKFPLPWILKLCFVTEYSHKRVKYSFK